MFNGSPENTIIEPDIYCPKCGCTGIRPDGTVCDCIYATHAYNDGICCLDIPQQYMGKKFSAKLVPADCGDNYSIYLQRLYNDLISMKISNYNCLICSPIAHSKTILAYSVLENLFRGNVPTFPVCSVMEIYNVLHKIDTCDDKPIEGITNPENLLKAPYIFIKLPLMLSWEVFPTMVDILSRRVRLGLSTIFLFDGYWDTIVKLDKHGLLTSLKGDGYYNTLDVHNFYKTVDNTDENKFQNLLKSF